MSGFCRSRCCVNMWVMPDVCLPVVAAAGGCSVAVGIVVGGWYRCWLAFFSLFVDDVRLSGGYPSSFFIRC